MGDEMKNLTFDNLRVTNQKRSVEWCGEDNALDSLEFRTIEFSGEAGELSDAIKKLLRFRAGFRGGVQAIEDICDELADVIISTDRVAEKLHIDLAEAVIRKFNKTSRKNHLRTMMEEG